MASGSLPDLNPMTNPTLGRHLGRWAEVYFTTPEDQREQAVHELLLELQREEASPDSSSIPEEPFTPPLQEAAETDVPDIAQRLATEDWDELNEPSMNYEPSNVATAMPSGVCPVCQYRNLPDQWFCGMCGVRLKSGELVAHGVDASTKTLPDRKESRLEVSSVVEPIARFESRSDQTLPSFSPEPVFESYQPARTTRDSLWPLEAPPEDGRTSTAIRVAAIALVLLLVVGGGMYYQRYSNRASSAKQTPVTQGETQNSPASRDTPPPAAMPPATAAVETPSHENVPSESSPTEKGASALQSPSDRSEPRALEPRSPEPTPERRATIADASAVTHETTATDSASAEGGAFEFQKAREILDGKTGRADSAQAVVWLWKAISKSNLPATLMLADLYARGEGVDQSCDQAKILLSAASRRGSALAGQKLKALQSSGCSQQ